MVLDSAIFYSNNIDVAVAFYRDVIGLEVEYQSGDKFVSFLFPDGGRLGIKKKSEEREVPGMQTVFVGVADVDSQYQKYKRLAKGFIKN